MPAISRKAKAMPSSPIRKLVPYAEAAKRNGKTVHHLNIGQPDIKTPEVVLNRMNELKRDVIEYSNSEGFNSYREGLAKYYQRNGMDVQMDDIIVTTGGSEALIFTMQTCFNIGDEIIIPEPFYANYNGFAVGCDVNVKPITATIENGFALPPVEEFEKRITDNTKGIVICNPGNPTGYLYTREELEALAELVRKYDLYLIADEVYREFCYDGAKPFSVLNLDGLDQNVILIDSVSKRYSMCGARVGALITKNKQVRQHALKFAQARLSPPTFGQIAAEAALETPISYFENVIKEYVERRDVLVEGLNKIKGVRCPKPAGAFYCIAQLPIDDSDRFCQWMLQEFSYENQTVMMAPGTGFYATRGLGEKEVRLAYVLHVDLLRRAVKCLEEALKVYPGRTNIN